MVAAKVSMKALGVAQPQAFAVWLTVAPSASNTIAVVRLVVLAVVPVLAIVGATLLREPLAR